eukprot:COSAG06_NODE_10545_length_1661_cov_2.323295_1_plen_345_part_00
MRRLRRLATQLSPAGPDDSTAAGTGHPLKDGQSDPQPRIRCAAAGVSRAPYSEAGGVSLRLIGATEAWAEYPELGWGRGQTIACLDDGCELSADEWRCSNSSADGEPKIAATFNSIDGNGDCTPVPPGYHGTSVGFPSSLNHDGKHGLAFNDRVAQVRCCSIVHLGDERATATLAEEALTMAAALEWVVHNRERLKITAVNFSMLDNVPHKTADYATAIDGPLAALREAGVWVSAPCGNNHHTDGISWPACATGCFGIGATDPENGKVHLDRWPNAALLVPAGATSSSNALAAAASMVLREAVQLAGVIRSPSFQECCQKSTKEIPLISARSLSLATENLRMHG